MRCEADIKDNIKQIVLEAVAGTAQRQIWELRPDEPLVSGVGLPSKQVYAVFDAMDRRLNLDGAVAYTKRRIRPFKTSSIFIQDAK
jgi:hypothetical protein